MRTGFGHPFTCLAFVVGCWGPGNPPETRARGPGLGDSVLTYFDSVAAIHSTHPDTGLLRRLHPRADTVLLVEDENVERLSGDSLFRRVLDLHEPVTRMRERFSQRRAHVLDAHHAIIAAVEDVEWVDATGPHQWHGMLTITLARHQGVWAVRSYHGATTRAATN